MTRNEKIVRVAEIISNGNPQIRDFINFLINTKFFCNVEEKDLDEAMKCEKPENLRLPVLTSKDGISCDFNTCVIDGVYTLDVGIDPKNCFDKLGKCSILCRFPMGTREFKRCIATLEMITDTKTTMSRLWMKNADGKFYGEFAKFGI